MVATTTANVATMMRARRRGRRTGAVGARVLAMNAAHSSSWLLNVVMAPLSMMSGPASRTGYFRRGRPQKRDLERCMSGNL
jgi:hypothetical protein